MAARWSPLPSASTHTGKSRCQWCIDTHTNSESRRGVCVCVHTRAHRKWTQTHSLSRRGLCLRCLTLSSCQLDHSNPHHCPYELFNPASSHKPFTRYHCLPFSPLNKQIFCLFMNNTHWNIAHLYIIPNTNSPASVITDVQKILLLLFVSLLHFLVVVGFFLSFFCPLQ